MENQTVIRAALYARVSTSGKGQDIGLQIRELREHAARAGWMATEFLDEGQSGRKTSRPAFNEMMGRLRKGDFDVVACWRLDRLTRGLRHAVFLLGEFKDLKAGFVSLRDGLSFTGPLALAMYALMAALAEAEVEVLRERTLAGLRNARAKGKRLGRPPSGVDPMELETLRRQGLSFRAIAVRTGVSRTTVSRHFHRDEVSPKPLWPLPGENRHKNPS